jgi:hypothetical protein
MERSEVEQQSLMEDVVLGAWNRSKDPSGE